MAKFITDTKLVVAMLAADMTAITANTTLADITSMSLTVAANESWEVEYGVIYNTPNATMDLKLGLTTPTSAAGWWAGTNYSSTGGQASWGSGGPSGSPSALVSLATALGFSSGNGTFGQTAKVILNNSTNAGTLKLQAAQNTSDAGNLIIKKGTYMRAHRLA